MVINMGCRRAVRPRWLKLAKFYFECLSTNMQSRSINTHIRTGLMSSHLDETSLVSKGFATCLEKHHFPAGHCRSPQAGGRASYFPLE